jgi:hypothetical protein
VRSGYRARLKLGGAKAWCRWKSGLRRAMGRRSQARCAEARRSGGGIRTRVDVCFSTVEHPSGAKRSASALGRDLQVDTSPRSDSKGSLCKVRDYAKGGVVRLASRCPMAARHRLALVIIAGSAVRRSGFQVYIGAGGLHAGRGCWAGVSLVRRQAGAELNMSPHGTCTRPR